MTCSKRNLVQAYFDEALRDDDLRAAERHLETCPDCREWIDDMASIRGSMQNYIDEPQAPAHLRAVITHALDEADARPRHGVLSRIILRFALWRSRIGHGWFSGLATGVGGALAVLALLFLFQTPQAGQPIFDELAAAHLRSMMAGHLTDIASSDQHAVKPWFEGRVDVSPPVADFPAQDFRLVGGRADYIGGRRVAALVYRKGAHIVNLFVGPDHGAPSAGWAERKGYHILVWHTDDLVFCAVSDAARSELVALSELVKSESAIRME